MRWREESEKLLILQNFELQLNFQQNNSETVVISKRLKLPYRMKEQIQIYSAA